MYEIAKNVIMRKDYELTDMISNLKGLQLSGDLTEEQLLELLEMARANALPGRSVDEEQRWRDHEARIRVIEEKLAKDGILVPSEEYPEYQAGRSYVSGDKVTFKGRRYVCILNEYTDSTTWSPEAYPAYWREVTQ